MGRRSGDEKMVPEKDEDPPSYASQGQGQAQGLSAEEAMGSRVEDEMLPEKNEDPPSNVPRALFERSKKSKFRGIWQKNGKWAAEILDKKGKRHWLGTYDTEEEAALAFDRGAIKYGRSDLKLNFPKLNFPKRSIEMLESLVFKNYPKKPRHNNLSEQLREPYLPLQPMSPRNREHTNEVNVMRDRPSTSGEVDANIEAVSSHQNATNAEKEDCGYQGKETAEVGHYAKRVARDQVALQEKQHDRETYAIAAALLSLSTS